MLIIYNICSDLTNGKQEQYPSRIFFVLEMAKKDFEIFRSSLVSDTRLIHFDASTPPLMTWIPETTPVQDLSTAFLRSELGTLRKSVQGLSSRWFATAPSDLKVLPSAQRAYAILNHLCGAYLESRRIMNSISDSLTHLTQLKISKCNAVVENLQYAQRARNHPDKSCRTVPATICDTLHVRALHETLVSTR